MLQIRTGGGFVPREVAFTSLPQFTLYADGKVIQTGVTTAVYPGPALPSLFVGAAPAAEVRAAVAAARSAGVTEDPDLGRPLVTDMPTTTFVLADEGRSHRVEAYALGAGTPQGLSAAQRENRERLLDLQRRMEQLAAAIVVEPYRAEAVSVLVRPYPEAAQGAPQDPPPDQADWPLGSLTSDVRERPGPSCLGFTGPEAERVLAAARNAKSNTQWRSGGRTWALSFRPELPGVTPCRDG